MGFDLEATTNRCNAILQSQGRYTPRRLNWCVFKAFVRSEGGFGKTSEEWKTILSKTTKSPSTNPWDVYYSLYKGLVVDEPAKGIFGKAMGVVKGAIGGLLTTGSPMGAAIGGATGLFGSGASPPPLFPTPPPVAPTTAQPKPILAGLQLPNKKILIGGAIAFGFLSFLTIMRGQK